MEKKKLNEITKLVLESPLPKREKAAYIKTVRYNKKFGETYCYHRAEEFVMKKVLQTSIVIEDKRNAIPPQGTVVGAQPTKSVGAEICTGNVNTTAKKKSPREVIHNNKCRAIDSQGKIKGKRQ